MPRRKELFNLTWTDAVILAVAKHGGKAHLNRLYDDAPRIYGHRPATFDSLVRSIGMRVPDKSVPELRVGKQHEGRPQFPFDDVPAHSLVTPVRFLLDDSPLPFERLKLVSMDLKAPNEASPADVIEVIGAHK